MAGNMPGNDDSCLSGFDDDIRVQKTCVLACSRVRTDYACVVGTFSCVASL